MSDMQSDEARREREQKRLRSVRKLAELTPAEWAKTLSDKDLLERVQGYMAATLPKALFDELKRRYNAKKYGSRPRVR